MFSPWCSLGGSVAGTRHPARYCLVLSNKRTRDKSQSPPDSHRGLGPVTSLVLSERKAPDFTNANVMGRNNVLRSGTDWDSVLTLSVSTCSSLSYICNHRTRTRYIHSNFSLKFRVSKEKKLQTLDLNTGSLWTCYLKASKRNSRYYEEFNIVTTLVGLTWKRSAA